MREQNPEAMAAEVCAACGSHIDHWNLYNGEPVQKSRAQPVAAESATLAERLVIGKLIDDKEELKEKISALEGKVSVLRSNVTFYSEKRDTLQAEAAKLRERLGKALVMLECTISVLEANKCFNQANQIKKTLKSIEKEKPNA